MMKLALMRTATGKEDPKLPLLQGKFIRVTNLINASELKEQTHLNINCSEETVNQAFVVELMQRNHY